VSIFKLLDWQLINAAIPFMGITLFSYVLFSGKICTQGKIVSTSVALAIMLWLTLVWADWGSGVFVASYQTMLARLIFLTISIFIIYELKRNTKRRYAMQKRNRKLVQTNKSLRRQVARLSKQVKQPEG
jgi:sensor histidine kinase YesM